MILLNDLMTFLNDFMGYTDKVPKIDNYLVNGLQVAGEPEIHKIATGVSANLRFFNKAIEAGAQALLVHHSMNPPNSVYFERDKIFMSRLKFLWQHNLSLIGYHYLLDSHPQVGHNAATIRYLGGELVELYKLYGQEGWGWIGEFSDGANLSELMAKCRELFKNNGVYYPYGNETVHRIVSICGGAPPRPGDYEWLIANKIDLFITGEPREWNQEMCREANVSMVAGGHYNSESIGLHELSKVIQEKFEVDIEFVDVPNIV